MGICKDTRLVILLGDADDDPFAPDLSRMDYAMAQGTHRLARGLWHFQHGTKLANNRVLDFGWRFEIAHEAGHVDQQIYDEGANILKGGGVDRNGAVSYRQPYRMTASGG
jgi:hypothetical protein